jgi:hypothetical protein
VTQPEHQLILRLAQDCSSSLVGFDDVASLSSESTAAISKEFAERSHLRQAIRAKRPSDSDTVSTIRQVRERAPSSFRHVLEGTSLSRSAVPSLALDREKNAPHDIHAEGLIKVDDNRLRESPYRHSPEEPAQEVAGDRQSIVELGLNSDMARIKSTKSNSGKARFGILSPSKLFLGVGSMSIAPV